MNRVVGAVAAALLLSSCGAAPSVVARDGLACDQDVSSDGAKDTVERIGGVTGDDYTVRFAKSTRIGVIALVDGDAEQAFEDLRRYPELTEVAVIEPDRDPGTITGFAQVDDLVADVCG